MDSDLCAKARDLLWSTLPKETNIKREDPETHIGPFTGIDLEEDVTNLRQGYKWQLRSVGTDQLMIDLVYSDTLQQIAEDLLIIAIDLMIEILTKILPILKNLFDL